MNEATREVETIVTISLDLRGEREFGLPQHRDNYTVLSVAWLSKSTNSHPITAKAYDSDNIEWTLSLRWSDLPQDVQEALMLATKRGDVPDVQAWAEHHRKNKS